jgi:hypothetical protein
MVDQEANERFKRARDLLMERNKRAKGAVISNNVSKMEKIFKAGGIKQDAVDHLIFWVKSVEMMRLFLLYGGDMHKLGPPDIPNPIPLLWTFTFLIQNHATDSFERRELMKVIMFLIAEGADVNAADDKGTSTFFLCARYEDLELCKMLVERGVDPTTKAEDGGTALHLAAHGESPDIFRYLVEDCGLDINAEFQVSSTSLLRMAM